MSCRCYRGLGSRDILSLRSWIGALSQALAMTRYQEMAGMHKPADALHSPVKKAMRSPPDTGRHWKRRFSLGRSEARQSPRPCDISMLDKYFSHMSVLRHTARIWAYSTRLPSGLAAVSERRGEAGECFAGYVSDTILSLQHIPGTTSEWTW